MPDKIGVVVVSYNAARAVRITLASLRQAKNEAATRIVLVDNASQELDRQKIRSAFNRHVGERSLPWEYIQSDRNLGFAGANNVGIRRLLEDPDVTHICLLNSDVIVTDRWLDQLLETGSPIISPVTNKAESEQCVPIDYTIEMEECLDAEKESIPSEVLARVAGFSHDWNQAWQGNRVEGEATFFCALIARAVIEDLGVLDERFFPGGYEDEDFCIRARQRGHKIVIARDVFVHHWGSASFGQLQYEYFNQRARQNRIYLETKHGVVRRRRAEKPFVSYAMDLAYAAHVPGNMALRRRFNDLYVYQLGATLQHFESEFKNLSRAVKESGLASPITLQEQMGHAHRFDNVTDEWKQAVARAAALFDGELAARETEGLLASLEYIAGAIYLRVDCNFAMHSFLYLRTERGPRTALVGLGAMLRRLPPLLKRLSAAIGFLLRLDGVVIFGGYPYSERQSDGYFQRIQLVDRLFAGKWRVYVESEELPGRDYWYDRPEARVLVLRIMGGPRRRWLVRILALVAVLRCRKIYFHSVLRMHDNRLGGLMYIPGISKVIDVHGVVPEEFRLHGDFANGKIFDRMERLAIQHADMIVVVTRAMEEHLRSKYPVELRGQVVILPMFAEFPRATIARPYRAGKPVIVYAGGLQKWQQVAKMIAAIKQTASQYAYLFYCPDPQTIRYMLPESVRELVDIGHKTPEELHEIYATCHYGLTLREEHIVNRVACPTKLVEYLAMGIVPILDSENIGDFKSAGMQFINLHDLLLSSLPDETLRSAMAARNMAVYENMGEIFQEGARQIRAQLSIHDDEGHQRIPFAVYLKAIFPIGTRRGQILRQIWRSVKSTAVPDHASKPKRAALQPQAGPGDLQNIEECDILVQVDNFEAGGLENIALDINEAFIAAGKKVALLVLGKAGASVQRARERGMAVVTGSPDGDLLRSVIESAKPKVVLAHYSINGVELYRKAGIPFIQMIQNAYMWFDEKQLAEFRQAAEMTTAFIALSEYAQDYSVRRLGVDPHRCFVLPCGINSDAFSSVNIPGVRSEFRRAHRIGEQDFVFLSVGAINHQKNHIATVRAFASIAGQIPRARLLILGPAYEKSLLEEIQLFVQQQRLNNRIQYLGAAADAVQHYGVADALVSAAFFEGGPLNLLEALTADLPVVMPRVGLAEHFKGMPGISIIEPPLDIFAFQGRLWQLKSNPEFEQCLAKAMLQVHREPHRPGLSAYLIRAFDRSMAYKPYVELIDDLSTGQSLNGKTFSTWLDWIGERA